MGYNRSKLSMAISMVLLSVASSTTLAFAQDQQSAQAADEGTEVIEVTGIRSSLAKSLATKQDSTGFVDAITAEDVGKLPDNNVAEALQRVAGVTIQRSRGEGDFISIRGLGPDFVKGTLNGRTLLSSTERVDSIFNGNFITSTGRATDFDILPSEVVTELVVSKSASANQIEGGVAGSVDVKMARPLALGNKTAFSATATYRDFNEETDPALSGLFSWSNEDDFGVLASVSYSERKIREDFSRSFFWLSSNAFAFFSGLPADARLDTNNDGTGDTDYGNLYQPLSNNAEVYEEDRERLTATTTVQWVGNKAEFVLDALYSKREIAESHQNLIHLPFPIGSDFGPANADGSFPTLQLVNDGVANNINSTLRPELTTDLQDYEDDLFSLAANVSTEIAGWGVEFDASYSKAEGSNTFDRVRWDGNNLDVQFNTRVDLNGYQIRQLNQGNGANTDLGNPDNFVVTVFDQRFATNEDTDTAFKIDAVRDLDSDFFSTVELGARYSSREKVLERARKGDGINIQAGGYTASDIGAFNRGASNFLDGQWDTNFDYSTLIFPDNAAALAFVRQQQAALSGVSDRTAEQDALLAQFGAVLAPLSADPASSFDTTEDTLAFYVQANIDALVGGMPLTGDIGLRYVDTSAEVNGFSASFRITDVNGRDTTQGFDEIETLDPAPISFDNDYDYVLPSVNLRLEVADNMYVRASASQTISRSPFTSFLPSFQGSAIAPVDQNEDGFAVDLTSGNPTLQPFESNNFDIGFEYYFGDASAFYIAAFRKDFDGFVINSRIPGPLSELGGTPLPVTGIVRRDGVETNVGQIPVDRINQPINAGSGDITGVEVGLQQSFESGFGYVANLSTVDSEATFQLPENDSPQTIDFVGVSDLSYNLTGFYESGPYQARISYNWRDEYLVEPNVGGGGQLVNDAYGQIDVSLSYEVNDNLSIVLSGINLNDEEQKVFQDLPQAAGGHRVYYSLSTVGQRISLGVRGSF